VFTALWICTDEKWVTFVAFFSLGNDKESEGAKLRGCFRRVICLFSRNRVCGSIFMSENLLVHLWGFLRHSKIFWWDVSFIVFPWRTNSLWPIPLMKRTVFWDVMLYSMVEVYWRFRGTYCLHLQDCKWSQTRSRLTKPQTTQHHIPEDNTLISHCCEDLISNPFTLMSVVLRLVCKLLFLQN
jgi:hypothetical protein